MEAPDEPLAHEAEQRLTLITTRFPDRFSEGQIGEIRKRIERSIGLGRSLRKVELGNGDGPDLIVAAFPQGTEAE